MAASTSSAVPARSALAVTFAGPLPVGGLAVGAAVCIAAFDPSTGGAYPVCPVHSVTGFWCPGCGLTRATHHLMHGDIGLALRHNALVVPFAVALGLAWIAWLADSRGRRRTWAHRAAMPAWLGLGLVAVTFTVLRNIPAFDVLRG